jgi:hypothetical protein
MADAVFTNKQTVLARLAQLPDIVVRVAEVNLDAGTDELVEALRRAAPVAPQAKKDEAPGTLRASIQKYPNADRALSWRIIAGARDAAGRLWARYVEFGHGEAGPEPFWFPTYRAWKKPFRSKLFSDTRRALKAWWPD